MQNVRTDLSLLLECLKCQMSCPRAQKQALLAVISICQRNEENVDYLKEVGGVAFVHDLWRSSRFPEVKETALFTLGTLAEANESCKQDLCAAGLFTELAVHLSQEPSLTQKRVAVYMLSVLVANNRRGQTLAQTSGCMDVLLNLFRSWFPGSGVCEDLDSAQLQLWASVSSALCSCVNNPQNEQNQCMCACVFPLVKEWLAQLAVPSVELAQPICSLLAMTMANNMRAQEYFASAGGLVTLSHTLTLLTSQPISSESCTLAIIIIRALSACITDNPVLAAQLLEQQLVPELVLLLPSPALSPTDTLSVLLTIAHCTQAHEGHQLQLMQSGGLSLLISLLTDSSDEELRKAAIFILHTCKHTMSVLGVCEQAEGVCEQAEGVCDMETHRSSARDMLQRIQQLEERQQQAAEWDAENPSNQQQGISGMPRKALPPMECPDGLWEDRLVRRVKGWVRLSDNPGILATPVQPPDQPIRTLHTQSEQQKPGVAQPGGICRPIFRSTEDLWSLPVPFIIHSENDKKRGSNQHRERVVDPERWGECGGREEVVEKGDGQSVGKRNKERGTEEGEREREETETQIWSAARQDNDNRPPEEGARQTPSSDKCPTLPRTGRCPPHDEISLVSELLDSEIDKILMTPPSPVPRGLRCAGCVLGAADVSSRDFVSELWSSRFLCEFHLVLLNAQETTQHTHTPTDTSPTPRSDTRVLQHTHTSTSTRPPPRPRTHMPLHTHSQTVCTRGKARMESRTHCWPRRGSPAHTHSEQCQRGDEDTHTSSAPQQGTDYKHTSGRAHALPSLTPLKRRCERKDTECSPRWQHQQGVCVAGRPKSVCVRLRQRRSFSQEEVRYLCEGVRRFGRSWNSILWAYPFPPGRTNTDLAKKYQRLQRASLQGLVISPPM